VLNPPPEAQRYRPLGTEPLSFQTTSGGGDTSDLFVTASFVWLQ
jgi:hypothetical protein